MVGPALHVWEWNLAHDARMVHPGRCRCLQRSVGSGRPMSCSWCCSQQGTLKLCKRLLAQMNSATSLAKVCSNAACEPSAALG